MVVWPRTQVIQACKDYAPVLTPILGVNMAQLLIAMAMSESSLGADCEPRYEQAYDVGGMYANNPPQPSLLAQYGPDAAKSYGPWQVLFCNLPGTTPTQLNTDFNLVTRMSISYLNAQIEKWKPKTVIQVGWMWNGGNLSSTRKVNPGAIIYGNRLKLHYDEALVFLEAVNVEQVNNPTNTVA
jgi:hypothetical protein